MLDAYKGLGYVEFQLLGQFSKYSYLELLINKKDITNLINIVDQTVLAPLSYAVKIKIFMMCIEISNNIILDNLSKKNKKKLKKMALINKIILMQCHSHFDRQTRIETVSYCRRIYSIGINIVSKHYPIAWLKEYYNFINENT